MIAFGCAITAPWYYDHFAGPGIELAAEASSPVFADSMSGSIARSYNLMLDRAAAHEDLEALVLVLQDAEITDRGLCEKVRHALEDPEVGAVGCVGSIGATTIAWWEGSVTWDAFVASSPHFAGAVMPALSWNGKDLPPVAPLGEVDTLYGFVMALSPWAVRNLRFDESLDPLHGYDFDLCLQVRAAGRKVMATDFAAVHHRPPDLVLDPEEWIEAHMLTAGKWDGEGVDWKHRAHRAEAEAGVARLASASKLLQAHARAEAETAARKLVEDTASWQVTEPLRKLNAYRRARGAPRPG